MKGHQFLSGVLTLSSATFAATFFSQSAIAATITATASGSQTPEIARDGTPVMNGDFLISSNVPTLAPVVGDRADERTTWDFDFTADANFPSFSTAGNLTSALLTLELNTCCSIHTDMVSIHGLPNILTEVIRGLPSNATSTIELELLDFYSSAQILDKFTSGEFGKIPMLYNDDAVVSFAKLELIDDTPESVPEPSAQLGLVSLAIVAAGRQLKRQKSRVRSL